MIYSSITDTNLQVINKIEKVQILARKMSCDVLVVKEHPSRKKLLNALVTLPRKMLRTYF